MKKGYSLFLVLPLAILQFCCTKKDNTGAGQFYGRWKTSYGDTVVFSKKNGKNILKYDRTMNPAMPMTTDHEYTYQADKLGLRDGFAGNDFHFFQTFAWVQPGHSFQVQGVEWFLFLSSTGTVFTFTRID
jgi:hypothetical protein